MKTTSQLYKQFLLVSQTNYTGTYLADHIEGLDENSIYRFLKGNTFTPKMVWGKTEGNIILSPDGKILFDDTVLDKDFSFKIDGVRSQYSGNAHGIIKGIGVIYCPIKSNQLVDDSLGERPYRAVDKLEWNDTEKTHGKRTKVNLFRVVVSTDKTEYVITNDMTQDSTEGCRKETAIRWKIEQFHREAKQVTDIEKNLCRTNRSQRNHICLAVQAWVFLSEKAHTIGTTICQVKQCLLDEYRWSNYGIRSWCIADFFSLP